MTEPAEPRTDEHSGAALPRAVLFDFSGTLFAIESAADALLAALGPAFVSLAPRLTELGAVNGSGESVGLPDHLRDAWDHRDLSAQAHRAAYSGLSRYAGLSSDQAEALYERGISAQAWQPYPDTLPVLRRLRERHVPVAVVSNIGWDPRPVLVRYGADDLIDVVVRSDVEGVLKPEPEIFRRACERLSVSPEACVMVGDNPVADAGCQALGIRFALVEPDVGLRAPDELMRALRLPDHAR